MAEFKFSMRGYVFQQGLKDLRRAFDATMQAVHTAHENAQADWLRDRKARILLQFGTERSADLPDIPTALEVAQDEASREMLRVYATKFQVAFPIFMPPEVPRERVEAVRAAFLATMKDPRFLEDARRGGIDVDPLSGEDVAKAVRAIEQTPQDIVDRLRAALGA